MANDRQAVANNRLSVVMFLNVPVSVASSAVGAAVVIFNAENE
jgi:flagellar biosynthesis protein FliQ